MNSMLKEGSEHISCETDDEEAYGFNKHLRPRIPNPHYLAVHTHNALNVHYHLKSYERFEIEYPTRSHSCSQNLRYIYFFLL